MTDMGKPRGTAGPPWSVDLLADLHAGALDESHAAELWPRVQADPEALAILQALDSTTSDLAALAEAPAPPMPADVASRIDAALAQEAARSRDTSLAPVVDLADARRRRNRQLGWGAGLVSTAAAAVAAVAILSPSGTTGGTPLAGEDKNTSATPPVGSVPSEPLAVTSAKPEAAFGAVQGVKDYGPLESRAGLEACLQANDIPTDGQTAGVRPAKVDGKDAVLAVLTTGKLATYRIVAVSPDCGADNPGQIYVDKRFGLGEN